MDSIQFSSTGWGRICRHLYASFFSRDSSPGRIIQLLFYSKADSPEFRYITKEKIYFPGCRFFSIIIFHIPVLIDIPAFSYFTAAIWSNTYAYSLVPAPVRHILHVISHVSPRIRHILHVISHVSLWICHILHVISHVSLRICYILHVISHVSPLICHILYVICLVSLRICHISHVVLPEQDLGISFPIVHFFVSRYFFLIRYGKKL